MKFHQTQLDNGLTVIAESSDQAYSTSLGFFVQAGARDETADVAGVSHFLEHMVFKGTPNRSAADVNRQLDEIGSNSNAYTSEEHTVYYASVLPEYTEDALDILADIMRPSLREDDFDMEKKVIIEEILRSEDSPPFGAWEKCMEAHFGAHPLSNNVLGSVESIEALPVDAMRAYFEQRYSPSNITLAASGCVDFDAFVDDVKQRCGNWKPFEAPRVKSPFDGGATGMKSVVRETASHQYAVQICPGPSAGSDERYAMRVLSMIIGDDSGSRMYWKLVETGLAEYAGVYPYEFQDAGIVLTYMQTAPERAQQVLDILAEIQEEVLSGGVAEAELELVKSKVCSHMVRQNERPSNRLFAVGSTWLQQHSYMPVSERIAKYQSLTLDDLHATIAKYPMTNATIYSVGPVTDLRAPLSQPS